VSKKKGTSDRDLLISLAASDLKFASIFAEGARVSYRSGNTVEGDFARLRALKFYSEVIRSLLKIAPVDREVFGADLANIRTQINWLSVQPDASHSSLTRREHDSMEKLLKLLEEQG
jgi:hypothetical protein